MRRYQVVQPQSLRIVGPAHAAVGERFTLQVEALDERGEVLTIGPYVSIAWDLPPPLRADNRSHCEFPPWCDSPPEAGTRIRGERPGAATVTARCTGLSASSAIEITGGASTGQVPR